MESFCSGFSGFWSGLQSVAWLEWVKTTFDLIKGVSWPLAVFGVVWLFRNQIRERIPDLISLGPSGAVLQPPQQFGSPQLSSPLETATHALPSVNTLAQAVQEELEAFLPAQREPRLVRALAEARLFAEFEFIFGIIFNSQIEALKELSHGPKTTAEAEKFFEEEVRPISKELYDEWQFDKWSAFLIAQYLVQVDGGSVQITQKGRDFLDFVVRHKGSFSRPY